MDEGPSSRFTKMPDAELIEFQTAAISTDANYVICLAIRQLSLS